MKKRLTLSLLGTLAAVLLFASGSSAQNKMQQCSKIQVAVDEQKGAGNWANGIAVLKLRGKGEGWTTSSGGNVKAKGGGKYRLNFGDGTHQVNVKASGGGSGLTVKAGSRPAIALVDVKKNNGSYAVRFEITGSPNDKAQINGCTGGSLYFDIGG